MTDQVHPSQPIVLVDDEQGILRSLTAVLLSHGYSNTIAISDSREVMQALSEREVSCMVLDLVMPNLSGQALLEQVVHEHPDMPVVVSTALNDVDTAVECMKSGAFDFLVKPIDENRILSAVRRAIEMRDLRRENDLLREGLRAGALKNPEAFSAIITANQKMLSIFHYIEAIAGTSQPVLIIGETGAGKEMIASTLHHVSERQGEFVSVNVGGLDDNLFADTLFGHAKGAYTGADRPRQGLIERAAGGTLFLDEIGDLSAVSQVKLLRLLQEREYFRLGEDSPRQSDARIVVATNRDLSTLQECGDFRKDLYYRLRSHHIHVPPLRERPDDLPPLVDHFIKEAALELGKNKPTPPEEIYSVLGAYHFPGNIRELKSLLFDAVARHESGVMSLETFRRILDNEESAPENRAVATRSVQFGPQLPTLKEVRSLLIDEAMRRSSHNQATAARLLGITRQGLNKQLRTREDKPTP